MARETVSSVPRAEVGKVVKRFVDAGATKVEVVADAEGTYKVTATMP